MDQYKGYSLFNDVEDAELRTRNRAVVSMNIISDHLVGDQVQPGGVRDFLTYLKAVPFEEREPVLQILREELL